MIHGWSAFGEPAMVGTTSDWEDELGRWLEPFLERLISLLPARPFQALMWALPAETISGAKRRDLSRGEQIGD
jgi:hypothetical protein